MPTRLSVPPQKSPGYSNDARDEDDTSQGSVRTGQRLCRSCHSGGPSAAQCRSALPQSSNSQVLMAHASKRGNEVSCVMGRIEESANPAIMLRLWQDVKSIFSRT